VGQCSVARDEWFGRLPIKRTMLASPAARARESAMHMSGQPELASSEATQPLVVVDKLHPICVSDKCEEIYAQKGETPLRTLLDADGGETAFGLYAEAACEELTAKFRNETEKAAAAAGPRERETYIAVFGHRSFLNSLAYAVATAAGVHFGALDEMLDMSVGEAEGILVPLYGDGKKAIHLKRPL